MECKCQYCQWFVDDQELFLLSSYVFKSRILCFPDFPKKWQDEVDHSNLSFLNIFFGIVPDGMKLAAFVDVTLLEVFQIRTLFTTPLLPPIQESWDGSQVADWLISAEIANESSRSDISEQLDGRRFLRGNISCSQEILREEAKLELRTKISSIVPLVWKLTRTSHNLCTATRQFFNMDFENISSMEELESVFKQRYSFRVRKNRNAMGY
jgi:hypothetical protein